ncbi:MAG: 16S rRNA (adenine(1518)-N(6)/adenine(1519)-N(6))-dimethyltransferase RsmA [Vicinamibacterales bacterium]
MKAAPHPVRGHVPRKRFGQNFLADGRVVARILEALCPRPGERVVEIGPGLGALTRPLLDRLDHLDVVEIDRDLAARLKEEFPADRLTVHVADALDFDFATLGDGLRVVGNLPYNISTPLLFRLAGFARHLHDIHVMLQKEVVDRMTAAPGTPAYGRLGVMLGYRFEVSRLFIVPPGAFRPQPKVDSAVARLRPYTRLPFPADDETGFARIVGAGFGKRRKTLRNALAGVVDDASFAAARIDSGRRAEDLGIAEFVALANAAAASAQARDR